MASSTAETFAALVKRLYPLVYQMGYRMTLSSGDTDSVVRETFLRAYRRSRDIAAPQHALLVISCASEVAQEQQRAREQLTFEELDALIRDDPTQSGVLDQFSAPDRDMLLWEMKQGCLTAVLNCLPPGERVAFVLSEMLGYTPERAARALGIKSSALRVRISRAKKKISGHLWPRCEHVNPRNPCHCPSRIGVSLTKGFIGEVRGRRIDLRDRPFDNEPPAHDPVALYKTLPEALPPDELLERLLEELRSGGWDA